MEDLLVRIASRRTTCGVVGLGFIGSTYMDALVNAGFPVRGFDRSPATVDRFRDWMSARNPESGSRWSADSDPAVLDGAEVVVVAVRVLPREDNTIDLEPLGSASEMLRGRMRDPGLILLASTLPPAATRCFAASMAPRPGILVAHSPERLSVGHDRSDLRRIPHLLAGVDAAATRAGAAFLSAICDRVVELSGPEVSELAKLLENAFLTTGIALSNEITRIAHVLGVPAQEVCEAAATKAEGYFPFFPGPGMGGHCLANDLAILRSTAARGRASSLFLDAVAETSSCGPVLVLHRLEAILKELGWTLRNLPILLVGVGFKPGTADTTGSPARELARLLRQDGADLSYLDSRVPEFDVDGAFLRRIAPDALDGRTRAAIVISGDPAAPLHRLAACAGLVLDTRGRSAEPRLPGVYTL
jgi:UDP-N-acetyl-D-glucosamine dehydrogenase